ncbi:MAG: hypothetical protein ACRC0S_04685 [Fusobacteriaceae bacterium]
MKEKERKRLEMKNSYAKIKIGDKNAKYRKTKTYYEKVRKKSEY